MSRSERDGRVDAFTLPSGWVTRVAAAEDMESLSTVAGDLAARIGFGGVTYSFHNMTSAWSPERAAPLAFFTQYPEPWIARYTGSDYCRIDPVVRAAGQGRAFRWSDIADESLSGAQRAMMAEARTYGIHDGFCVPARTAGTLGLFNALADGSEDDRRAALTHGTESLTALGLVVHERARHLMLRAGGAVLSDLDPEALRALELLAAGADTPEAAAVLNISEQAVDRLLVDLMRRLKLPRPSGLRARALMLGLSGLGRQRPL
ncbi:autoinducer binding domain-containing protein [Caenispirillum salinarum]|uniref:autoinducer binding domain-containing protein n=1 Tax=Caenispirillum salinarum TaxID=859058 RepID=UPI0038500317